MGNSVHGIGQSLYSPSGARKYLTREERRRFLEVAATLPPIEGTFCLTLAHSGCRISEALELRACDVDVAIGAVVLRTLKKRGRLVVRLVPVPSAYLATMGDVHGHAAAGRLLWPWHRTKAWQIVKGAMLAADVHGLHASPKGLRHAFGVNAVMSGVPLPLVQKWLGHESPETTARSFSEKCNKAPALAVWPGWAWKTCRATHARPLPPSRTTLGIVSTSSTSPRSRRQPRPSCLASFH